jgi:LDH2 family malate/lactate/ureidoglycolate dehydrogenase
MSTDTVLADEHSLSEFIERVLVSIGARQEHAASVARVLVDADLRGIDSHGTARLPAYVRLVDLGFLDLEAEPKVSERFGAVAVVDAGNGLGQPAGELAMQTACEIAAEHGIGWVTAHHSNHFGIVGYYTRLATARGFVSVAGTNSAAVVAPTRAAERFIGTNPLSFGAPGSSGPGISLDMSTSAVAGGKLEKATREGLRIPEGWVLTVNGQPTTDPASGISAGGALLPLGGTEEHSSYKGYGLGLMVEVMSSVLVGAPHGPGVGPLTSSTPKSTAEVSHFFMALDPGRFGDTDRFAVDVDTLCAELRSLPSVDADLPVLVPGDPEETCLRTRRATGIPIHRSVLAPLQELATRTGTPMLNTIGAAAC